MPTSASELEWLAGAVGPNVRDFYMEIGVLLPDRGGEETPVRCFANPQTHSHDDRTPSCSVNLLTGLWHCQGCGEAGNPYQAALACGYPEKRARDLARKFGLFLELKREKTETPSLPGERQLKAWRRAMRENESVLRRLGAVKGWSPYGIVRLGLGWDGERVVFPIRDKRLKICGIVRYLPGGSPKSLAVPGSKRDLFPAPELIHRRHPLFVVEGEPDVVAVWSLGLKAIGVPGAGSWRPEWAQRLQGRRVIVLADCDPQGRLLAERVAAAANAKLVDVEPGRTDGFDIGSMVHEAASEGGIWQVRRILEALV